jgi:anaerobic magnesium-protoporphyrin IX monomethyl ester cyclase
MGHALLINPSYFRTYGSTEGGIAFPVYPILSLAAIGGSLKERGHTFRILDLSYRRYEPDLLREVLAEERPDVVGVTATTPQMNQARDLSYLVKEVCPDAITVAGGSHPSALPAETLRESVLDHVACGECDHVLSDLLDGVDPATIGGLYRREGDAIEVPGPAGLIEDLDTLPMPAWEDYPIEGNRQVSKIIARHLPVTSIEFSRGCIYSCDFCASKNTMGRGYRKKSPERCADEMARLEALGFREVVVHDDIFTTDTAWAKAVCEEIIRRGIDIAWTCSNGIRVDAADAELFDVMRRAGCYRVYFGFETGNDEVLKAFGKGGRATLDQGIEAVELARAAGLEPNGFFLVGLMPDTEASMQDTIDYAKKVRLDVQKCGICVPLPGTPMFRDLHAQGRIKTTDWDAYTVYNKAENIFDHPTLDWPTITRYFDRFYRQVYLRPGYIGRRLRFLLKNGELWQNVRFMTRFLKMLSRDGQEVTPESYAYEDRWRPLDLRPDQPLGDYPVPRARRSGTALTMGRRRGVDA